MDRRITIAQAYKAMFIFIKNYYDRKDKPSEIGGLLSDVQLLSYLYNDPQREHSETRLNTADPASWEKWLEAIETMLNEENENEGA